MYVIQYISRLKLTEILGVVGFIIALINLVWRYKEIRERKPKLKILPIHPPQEVFQKITCGDFFIEKIIEDNENNIRYINPEWKVNEGKLFFNFLISNFGGQPIQILYMLVWIKDIKKNRFYQLPLKHSLDFDKSDEKDKTYCGPYLDIIDVKPYTTLEKRYLIDASSGSSISHLARKTDKYAYIEVSLSDGSTLRKWI